MPYQNYIKIETEERDKPIYRIMPVNRLLQCFSENKLILVPPSKWDDPFENWMLGSDVECSSTGQIGDMKRIRDQIYGQCWTQHSETDAMWRIYSPSKEGAKVKTTPRKLLEALKANAGESADVHCFIGKVQYMNENKLEASLKNIYIPNTNGSGIAETLLYKREEFSHEKEIRIVYTNGTGEIYPVPIDPNNMFDEITFDPRIDLHLYETSKVALESKGFSGRIAKSTLYELPKKLLFKI
jgi:hypothetical protein